ncbi:MAG: hypothetical protein AAGG01_15060, partial [Planctomycetota bacterium]
MSGPSMPEGLIARAQAPWLLRCLYAGWLAILLSPSLLAWQDAETVFQAAYTALVDGDRERYFELRPGLKPAQVSQARRVFLDLYAVPPHSLEDEERLELISEWLDQYDEADSWRARLAVEGADTARILKRWDLSSRLLDRAEVDLGTPPEAPEGHWVETRAWLHDVRGVLVREMGLFDVAARELAAQEIWASKS